MSKSVEIGGDVDLGQAEHAFGREKQSQIFRKRIKHGRFVIDIEKGDGTTTLRFLKDGEPIDMRYLQWHPADARDIGQGIIEAVRSQLPARQVELAVQRMREALGQEVSG